MYALWQGPLVTRNRLVSIGHTEFMKQRIPGGGNILKILVFGKQENPAESDSMTQEETLRMDLIIPSKKSARTAGYALVPPHTTQELTRLSIH